MLTLCIGLVWVLFSIIFENNADLKLVTRETAVSLCDIWFYNSFFKALNSSLNCRSLRRRRTFEPSVTPCKVIQESLALQSARRSARRGLNSRYWIPDYLSVVLGFQILNISGKPDFFELNFRFLSPGFLILQAKISQIPESGLPYMGRPLSLFRVHAESIQEVTLNVVVVLYMF